MRNTIEFKPNIRHRKTTKEWTPVRSGPYYCSPRCGGGKWCTAAMHDQAVKDCAVLVKRLGKDWRGEVWENMGWHSAAISKCGRFKVTHYRKHKIATAFLGGADGFISGRWAESASTPEIAIKAVINRAHEELAWCQSMLVDLPGMPTQRKRRR